MKNFLSVPDFTKRSPFFRKAQFIKKSSTFINKSILKQFKAFKERRNKTERKRNTKERLKKESAKSCPLHEAESNVIGPVGQTEGMFPPGPYTLSE